MADVTNRDPKGTIPTYNTLIEAVEANLSPQFRREGLLAVIRRAFESIVQENATLAEDGLRALDIADAAEARALRAEADLQRARSGVTTSLGGSQVSEIRARLGGRSPAGKTRTLSPTRAVPKLTKSGTPRKPRGPNKRTKVAPGNGSNYTEATTTADEAVSDAA